MTTETRAQHFARRTSRPAAYLVAVLIAAALAIVYVLNLPRAVCDAHARTAAAHHQLFSQAQFESCVARGGLL